MRTVRLAFDARALWSQIEHTDADGDPSDYPFAFLGSGTPRLSLADLEWACERLVVEVKAPASSADLTAPAEAEELLLRRVREEVGAGTFPNAGRSAIDVAAAMIGTAEAARQGRFDAVTAPEVLRRAQLRSDFGAVARMNPVDPAMEVARNTDVGHLAALATQAAEVGGAVLVVGPPGHGKSWLCKQVLESLDNDGWLTAEHYCYLGVGDDERDARVLADTVFGSLVNRIEQADGRLVDDLRPLLAGDEDALIACVARSVELEPFRKAAIVVDGIDHVTRVLRRLDGSDPSLRLAERLASLAMPPGSVLIVLSQPGSHLAPLEESGAQRFRVAGLDRSETEMLATKLCLIPSTDASGGTDATLVYEVEEVAEIVDVLVDRSGGNALYTTYLCREALRHDVTIAAPAAAVENLPPFDESLKGYYDHLRKPLDEAGAQIADVIGLLDFAVSREELRSILPTASHRVDGALDVLAPVLTESAAGGIRVYHESFARHLCDAFEHDDAARRELLGCVTDWLEGLGFFDDARAFRHVIPLLGDAGRDHEALSFIESDFVARSVAAGFTTSEIVGNLASVVGCAARAGDWPAVIRSVELSRAAVNYQEESLDPLLARYSDVPIAVLGSDIVAARLVHDERPIMQIGTGLRICAAVDHAGAVAPWRQYLTKYHPGESVDSAIDRESSLAADVAWLRGWLRLARSVEGSGHTTKHDPDDPERKGGSGGNPILDPEHVGAPIDWHRIADFVQAHRLPALDVAESVFDTHGVGGLLRLVDLLDRSCEMCLAIAELVATCAAADDLGEARYWALEAVRDGIPPGALHVVLSFGVDVCELDGFPAEGALERLCALTRDVQEATIEWESETIDQWLDECAAAAHRGTLALDAAEALIEGEGWYRCWLRFTIGLARAEAAEEADRSARVIEALSELETDLRPFAGSPRSCDLYSIHHRIQDTIWRAVSITGERWVEAIRLLSRVSNALTATLQGSIGGPVPPALVLGFAVDGVTSEHTDRRALAAELLDAEISEQSAVRHYPDLAENRLLEARLAAAAGDPNEAQQLWVEACRLMSGYGWRKDITIFELLDPLEMLIDADAVRGRACLASAQALCNRVARHTDGKETRHAPQVWWRLLAKADPAALARLTTQQLLRDCNFPNPVRHRALTDMWRQWHGDADPLLAGALRLTLDTTLSTGDVETLERLAESQASDGVAADLMVWLLARADERPASYSYPEVPDIGTRDQELLAGMNAVAEAEGLPAVTPIDTSFVGSNGYDGLSNEPAQDHGPRVEDLPIFPAGESGLAKSVRAWRGRPYRSDEPCWDIAEFAEAIAGRLVGLVEASRFRDAVYYLRLLTDASWTRESASLLQRIAHGLEERYQPQLAATAHALAWTRAGGDFGYRGFGGDARISSLRRATEIDATLALEVVAAETQDIVAAGKYGTYGFSKTLIHAFCVGALAPPGTSPLDIAFAAWDEVRSVTDYRAPRVHDFDDPPDPYMSNGDASCDVSQDELDGAFALGVFGGLAGASREKKRRSLLAVELLLSEPSAHVGAAASLALSELSDPATLSWLLRLIEESRATAPSVVAACTQTLVQLANSEHLVVRALARRLLQDGAPPLAAPINEIEDLPSAGDPDIWIPANHDEDPGTEDLSRAEAIVQLAAGNRLRVADKLLPGLHRAVASRVAKASVSDDYRHRFRTQLRHYRSTRDEHWPDAYLHGDQTVEDALQRAASTGRVARVRMGQAGDPAAWEDRLADLLLDDPKLLLALESRRIPRPALSAPPQPREQQWPTATTATTLGSETADIAWAEALTEVRGWPLITTVELQEVEHPDYSDRREITVIRHRVLELQDSPGISPNEPSLVVGNIRRWVEDLGEPMEFADVLPASGSMPMFGLDLSGDYLGDGRRGLGMRTHLLVPADALLWRLGLRAGEPFKLRDSHGGGIALVTWRTGYDEGVYSLPRPRLTGSGVIAHPDLVRRLIAHCDGQLYLRDVIVESTL